jgi:hypothetical protein
MRRRAMAVCGRSRARMQRNQLHRSSDRPVRVRSEVDVRRLRVLHRPAARHLRPGCGAHCRLVCLHCHTVELCRHADVRLHPGIARSVPGSSGRDVHPGCSRQPDSRLHRRVTGRHPVSQARRGPRRPVTRSGSGARGSCRCPCRLRERASDGSTRLRFLSGSFGWPDFSFLVRRRICVIVKQAVV